jgi:TonB family protein
VRPQRSSFLDLDGPEEDDQGSSITHSILGLDREVGRKAPSRPAAPEEKAPDAGVPAAKATDTALPEAKADAPSADVPVPEFERDLEDRVKRPIPFERAVLFSLAAHVAFLLFLILAPASTLKGRGLLAAFFPPPEDTNQEKIPIVFREAPGPARENPRRSEPSDKTRRAGGGDPARQRADTPFVPKRNGAEGLAPGASRPSSPAVAQQQVLPNPGSDRTAAAAPGEKLPSAPDAFQVPQPGATSTGPDSRLAGLDRAIRDAAKAVGSTGQGGAGSPNPDGGFVDSGPLSFDTSWYDWGPYAEEMIRRIKLHWEIPELARIGMKGRLTIRFFIMANGQVEGAHIVARSGTPPFDFAALQAILKSDPFRPLPKDLLAQLPGKDREGITVTFFYNMRPEDAGKPGNP